MVRVSARVRIRVWMGVRLKVRVTGSVRVMIQHPIPPHSYLVLRLRGHERVEGQDVELFVGAEHPVHLADVGPTCVRITRGVWNA
jgi:hypothetical protein